MESEKPDYYAAKIILNSIFWTLCFFNTLSPVLYIIGNFSGFTWKTQFFLLNAIMTSGICIPLFGLFNILLNCIIQKKTKQNFFAARLAAYLIFSLAGIFWTAISGIILTITKGSI
ncbi:MAG: hypothetical protein LBV52_06685 [Spirochaetaceae bacterium]|jgi:hypothetical protein|nr:hypothetical protein [Spirochaetaceae bacterium]